METLHREKVAVMGSGSWGTALAVLLAENGHDVALWSYRQEEAEAMAAEGENREFLPELRFQNPFRLRGTARRL